MLVNRVVTDVSLTKWSPEKAYSQRDTLSYRDRGTSVQLTYRDKNCQSQGQQDANKCSTRVLINCFSDGVFLVRQVVGTGVEKKQVEKKMLELGSIRVAPSLR